MSDGHSSRTMRPARMRGAPRKVEGAQGSGSGGKRPSGFMRTFTGLPVRTVLALAARAARRSVPPYPAEDGFAEDDALAIGSAEAAAAGIPFGGRVRPGDPKARLAPLARLAEAAEDARSVGGGCAGKVRGARGLRGPAVAAPLGMPEAVRSAPGIRGWADLCFGRDVSLARRAADAGTGAATLGSALDAGGGGPFGPLWAWDLASFDDPGALVRALLPGLAAGGDIRMDAWYFGELLDAGRAGELVRRASAGSRGVFPVAAAYADVYGAGVEDLLAERGIPALTRESFPGMPPKDGRGFAMLLAQSAAHARLGIGPHHSPLGRPTLLQRAAAEFRGSPADAPDDVLLPDGPRRPPEERVLAWIAREFQDGPVPDAGTGA